MAIITFGAIGDDLDDVDHVNVGFFFGALLNDPARLLEGTGKRGRHVKLRQGCGDQRRLLQIGIEGSLMCKIRAVWTAAHFSKFRSGKWTR